MNFPKISVGSATMLLWSALASAESMNPIAAPGEMLVATMRAEGVQLYECKADAAGRLEWQFREPVATLLFEGETVGRHFAGPTWELTDGSKVVGTVVARAPGASAMDIALLKLEAEPQRNLGLLAGVTTIQRLNTKGGVAQGTCETPGELLSSPYSADYNFYRKPRWLLIPNTAQHD